VFFALGSTVEGERIVAAVRRMLPGMPEPKPWEFTGAKKGRSGPVALRAEALVTLMEGSQPRWWAVTEVQDTLGIDRQAWKDVAADLRNSKSTLTTKLAAMKVRYRVEGVGRGSRSWLIKD
jgi:hypothetical protein